jgi:membrane protein
MHDMMQRIWESLDRGRRFVTHDVWRIGRPGEEIPHSLVIKHIRVVILLVQGMVKDALLLRASALTFTTTLAIVPLLAVMLYVVSILDLESDVFNYLGQYIFQRYAQVDAVDPDATIATANATLGALEDAANGGPAGVDPVELLIAFAKRGSNPKTLGVMGIFFIFATVFGLMSNIESSFNQIWGIRRSRSYYRMFTDYLAILIMLPLLVTGIMAAHAILKSQLFQGENAALYRFFVWSASHIVVWLAFTALYYFVPNTRVRPQYALLGGVVAGILWNLASWGYLSFTFSASLPRYTLLYSTFAQVPILLMWIYLSWVILLFGAELCFAYQNEKTYAMERLSEGASQAYREAVGLRAMFDMASRFDRGEPGLDSAAASESWNVPSRLVNDVLEKLEAGGLARPCATEPVTWLPARSLERIRPADVAQALREAGRDPSDLRADPEFSELYDAMSRDVGNDRDKTLAELIRDGRFPALRQPDKDDPAAPEQSQG